VGAQLHLPKEVTAYILFVLGVLFLFLAYLVEIMDVFLLYGSIFSLAYSLGGDSGVRPTILQRGNQVMKLTSKEMTVAQALRLTRPSSTKPDVRFQWEADTESIARSLQQRATLHGRVFDLRKWQQVILG